METGSREKLLGLLKTFRNAMLVTHGSDQTLRSRPMALMKVEEASGDIWFISSLDSGKVDEITKSPQVNVSLQAERKFLSVSGRAQLVKDRQKIDELWTEECKVYFPKGKDDPEIVLIRVDASEGEYWDNEGINGLKFLFETAKAYVTGTKPEVDQDQHGSVTLSHGNGASTSSGGTR